MISYSLIKLCYGAKVPQTPIAFPFAHTHFTIYRKHKIPFRGIKIPYFRLPGYSKPSNGEIVVFNYPDGDTVALKYQNMSYYQLVREIASSIKQEEGGKKSDAYYQEKFGIMLILIRINLVKSSVVQLIRESTT